MIGQADQRPGRYHSGPASCRCGHDGLHSLTARSALL